MGVRILSDVEHNLAALYCSTTDTAFGPVFYGGDGLDADERAERFLKWLPQDARRYLEAELAAHYADWLSIQDLAAKGE